MHRGSAVVTLRPKPIRAASCSDDRKDNSFHSTPRSNGGVQACFQRQGAAFKAVSDDFQLKDAARRPPPASTVHPLSIGSAQNTSPSSEGTRLAKIEPRKVTAPAATLSPSIAVLPKVVGASIAPATSMKPTLVYVAPSVNAATTPTVMTTARKDGTIVIPATRLQIGNNAFSATLMANDGSSMPSFGGANTVFQCPSVVVSADGLVLNGSVPSGCDTNAPPPTATLLVQGQAMRIATSCSPQTAAVNAQVQYFVPSFSVPTSPTVARQQSASSTVAAQPKISNGGTEGVFFAAGSQYFAALPSVRTVSLVNGAAQLVVLGGGQSPMVSGAVLSTSFANQKIQATRFVC